MIQDKSLWIELVWFMNIVSLASTDEAFPSTETCSSPNDELVHVRSVRQLHRTSYSSSEPFTIPPRIYQSTFTTPTKSRVKAVQQTPSTVGSSPPSSISSSPAKPESPGHIRKVGLRSNE